MRGTLDVLTRFVMLVLAGMISLSMVGAINAISSNDRPAGIAEAPRPAPVPPEVEQRPAEARPYDPRGGIAGAPGEGDVRLVAAPPPQRSETDRWLEAIAYALVALAGILALIAVILWRGVSELRRSADAREAQSSARS